MSGLKDRILSAGDQISAAGQGAIPGWLVTGGIAGWLVAGMAAAVAIGAWLFTTSASISIPLLVAMVIGMVAYPLCERMTARRVPKAIAAGVVLLMLVAIAGGVIWITVEGVISQWPNIKTQIEAGVAEIRVQLEDAGVNVDAVDAAADEVRSAATSGEAASNPLTGSLLSSMGSAVSAGVSGIASLLFGLFIGGTLLFYVLADFPTMADWVSRHMGGLPVDVGAGIVEDAVSAMRGYFRGTTITGLVVAAAIGGSMLVMGVPLAIPVALVTFLTCYIPYFGSIVSGAFAFLIALGSNGLPTAIALLIIVLIAQNVLQTVINARVMGSSLNLHPLVVLVVTMLGGIFGGLLGAALGAPLTALGVNAAKRLSAAFEPSARGSGVVLDSDQGG